jgi:hypothetical protein
VHKSKSISAQANTLIVIASEGQARRKVAKLANLPSGALPVLSLIVFRHEQGKSSRPKTVYAAEIVNEALARSYIRQLVAAKLVALTVRRGVRWLAPTLDGVGLAAKYYRAIREGRHHIETHN